MEKPGKRLKTRLRCQGLTITLLADFSACELGFAQSAKVASHLKTLNIKDWQSEKPDKMKKYCLAGDMKDNTELISEYEDWHKKENAWPVVIMY